MSAELGYIANSKSSLKTRKFYRAAQPLIVFFQMYDDISLNYYKGHCLTEIVYK